MIVIVGETASGKSSLAIDIAEKYNGEIICADSRTVYKGMDIGTAKPSNTDQAKVPHHILDVVNPDESFNVSTFQSLAEEAIKDTTSRGKLPILVGGTGLYVDSVLFNFSFRKGTTPELRAELEALTRDELQLRVAAMGLELPTNRQNPRHLIRTIETQGQISIRNEIIPNTLVIGLMIPKEELEKRIVSRAKDMLAEGLETEVGKLVDKYGWPESMQGVCYYEWQAYFAGTQTLEETLELIIIATRQYAKRQRAWFKRNKHINWVSSAAAAQEKVMTFLQRNK